MGLLKVGPEGGLAMPLVTEAEGVPLGFTNDLDIDDDGTVYFTDSSTNYQRRSVSLHSFFTGFSFEFVCVRRVAEFCLES